MIMVRPFKNKSDNLIEIVNELLISIVTSILIFVQSEDQWNDIMIYSIIGSLLINNTVSALISLIIFIMNCRKCRKNKRQESRIIVIKPKITDL
jgi:hypothetical protein